MSHAPLWFEAKSFVLRQLALKWSKTIWYSGDDVVEERYFYWVYSRYITRVIRLSGTHRTIDLFGQWSQTRTWQGRVWIIKRDRTMKRGDRKPAGVSILHGWVMHWYASLSLLFSHTHDLSLIHSRSHSYFGLDWSSAHPSLNSKVMIFQILEAPFSLDSISEIR